MPRFPSDDQEARGQPRAWSSAELPGRGLGLQLGAHLYPLRWRAITFGVGGEFAAEPGSAKTPPSTRASRCASGDRNASRSIAPQLSFNFGTGNGWSYLSGGLGRSTWAITPEGQEGYPAGRRSS